MLSASLGLTDKIVGLKTSALAFDDQSSVFKYHGECIVPFSLLVSGEVATMIDNALEGIPSFSLVTSNCDSHLSEYYPGVQSIQSDEEKSFDEESSNYSLHEGATHSRAFLQLMEESDEFDRFEKNVLLKFGIDSAQDGNILYRASFLVT